MSEAIHLSNDELEIVFKLTESQCSAYKNWIATAVEGGKFEYAQKLTKELRAHQDLLVKLNGKRRERHMGEWSEWKD